MNDAGPYILGLDIGSASIGWACVTLDRQGRPETLLRAGVRIFEPGVEGSALDIERGKDQSKAVERRGARLQRRQLRRRTARQRELFRVLQQARLLPDEANGASSEARHRILIELDTQIEARFRGKSASFAELPLYRLRARALDYVLEPHELGRVLFHLSQRRGFKSNRAAPAKKGGQEEELGQVKKEIGELAERMRKANARTLGEYFAGIDPHTERVRRRWTARAMFEHEFAAIWSKQQAFHPDLLTPALREEVASLLFYQRPIARQAHLVGECELEPGRRRAPWASLAAQRFRVLQKVHDLRVQMPDGTVERPLSNEERGRIFGLLNREGSKTFVQVKTYLGLPKESRFNLERSDAKSLPGNRTEHSMRKVFGERWDGFSEGKRNQIVENWRAEKTEEQMLAEAREGLALDPAAAALLVSEQPQEGYCSLSLAAIEKLMPLMVDGKSFKEAEVEVYGARFTGLPIYDRIPLIKNNGKSKGYLPNLRNPAVERALTEVRKVVNALVKEHGKPWEVRIELARELKKPRAERAKATVDNRKREADNKKLAERMARECGLQNPSRKDLEKAKLYVECGGICSYTGRSIPFSQLFDNSEFDVEHILPRSQHLDDSFQNKTLCFLPENRDYKCNRTPWEAYGSDPERWAQILVRVAKWNNLGKLKRFKLESEQELEEFSARQLNDTRYSSVLAAQLLGSLYGGRDIKEQDGTARQVVFVSSGAVTATLRRSWGLESILQRVVSPDRNAARGKPRTDHRHHAIDALTIALTRQGVIQQMARASALEPWQAGMRGWRRVPEPWTTPEFLDGARRQIEQMLVSHRPEHKVSGELHQGTNYGKPYLLDGKQTVHTRRLLSSLSVSDIESDAIVDPVVRSIVRAKLRELGGDPKLFNKPENAPQLPAGPHRTVPIRKVRIRESKNPISVGQGSRERWVYSGGIHHIELFVARDTKRREVWDSKVVQITEAYERMRRKQPVVRRSLENSDAAFLFSLMKDDTVEMSIQGERRVMRVKMFFDTKQIWFVPVNDANLNEVQMKQGIAFSRRPNTLKELDPVKVIIDLLGRVRPAHD